MVVAVTGANGFIGRHLVAALERAGHSVRPVVRRDFESSRAASLFSGADVVVHCAASTRAPSHALLRRSNVDLAQQAIDAATAARVARFVFISSQAAAGPARSLDAPVRESDEAHPVEEYGRTKLAAELLVQASAIPSVILRPAAVYGPDDRDFAALFALARRGIAIHPANRDQWISIIHVDDCVRGILAAIESPTANGRTYFLANTEPVQWNRLFQLAAHAAGRRLWLDLEIPATAVRIGAWLGDAAGRLTGRAPLLSSEKIRLARDRYWICSSELAERELGVRPAISLPNGIASVAGSWTGTLLA